MDKIIHDLYQSENNGKLDIDSVQNAIMLSKSEKDKRWQTYELIKNTLS